MCVYITIFVSQIKTNPNNKILGRDMDLDFSLIFRMKGAFFWLLLWKLYLFFETTHIGKLKLNHLDDNFQSTKNSQGKLWKRT